MGCSPSQRRGRASCFRLRRVYPSQYLGPRPPKPPAWRRTCFPPNTAVNRLAGFFSQTAMPIRPHVVMFGCPRHAIPIDGGCDKPSVREPTTVATKTTHRNYESRKVTGPCPARVFAGGPWTSSRKVRRSGPTIRGCREPLSLKKGAREE